MLNPLWGKIKANLVWVVSTPNRHLDISWGNIHLYHEISKEAYKKILDLYEKGLNCKIEKELSSLDQNTTKIPLKML